MGDTERLGGKTRVPDLPDSGIVFSSGCSVAAILGVHRRTLRYWGGGREPREPGDYYLGKTGHLVGKEREWRTWREIWDLYLGFLPFRLRVTRR